MKTWRRAGVAALAGAVLVSAPACAPLSALDEIMLPNGSASQVTGEIRSVDTRRGRIQVRDQNSNRTHTLHYDNRTRVVYRQRQYPASALERGDMVRVRVTRDRSGNQWAEHVEVRQSMQDRRTANARVQRIDGVVRQVDNRRGVFTIEPTRSRAVVVYVPRNINGSDARRFDRLRRGDRVRVEVRQVNANAAELVRFR